MTKGSNKTVDVTVRKSDEWVIEYLQMIVDVKKDMGIRTSISYEVMRLVKRAIHTSGDIPDAAKQKFADYIRDLGAGRSGDSDKESPAG